MDWGTKLLGWAIAWLWFFLGCITVGLTFIGGRLAVEYNKGSMVFVIDGTDIGRKGTDEVNEYISENIKTYIGNLDITSATTLDYNISTYKAMGFLEWFIATYEPVELNIERTYDTEKLRAVLEEYNNKNTDESRNAVIRKMSDRFIIEPEHYGKEININKVLTSINDTQITSLENYYIQPDIKELDLRQYVTQANNKINWSISYDNGNEYKMPIENIEMDNETYEILIDYSFIDNVVHELEKSYDCIGKEIGFRDSQGNEKIVSGGTWGTLMDSEKEKEYITELFKLGESETGRRPIMKQDYTSIGDTYIEISLADQHIWYYKDSCLISESNIVTGDISKKRGTPSGVYFISERVNGKYLRGTGYTTWVDKWMRLTNTGIGLHDAGWRSSFGGDIYKSNGSHGCVNLPKSYAYELYKNTYVGMPVIIY